MASAPVTEVVLCCVVGVRRIKSRQSHRVVNVADGSKVFANPAQAGITKAQAGALRNSSELGHNVWILNRNVCRFANICDHVVQLVDDRSVLREMELPLT